MLVRRGVLCFVALIASSTCTQYAMGTAVEIKRLTCPSSRLIKKVTSWQDISLENNV